MSIASVLFPNVTETIDQVKARFPKRDVPPGAIVTRFAPSPTGFIHIGGISTALIASTLARQSGGVFILRIEDTDQSREIKRGVEQIVEALAAINLLPDEGPHAIDPITEQGDYGPYIQSKRVDLYHAYAKDLVERGLAYPCFMPSEELESIRKEQEARRVTPGIYGEWARSRSLTDAEIEQKVRSGDKFVIRIKAPYPTTERVVLHDLIRGDLDMPANEKDMVLLKSDGLPTYHFAHVVDDALMDIGHVIRGDEWLATTPLHLQVIEAIGRPMPQFAHLAPIAKMEGSSKRKLSKRKDPEAAMAYYYERGYPIEGVLEYLLNLANSNFEEWRNANPDAPYTEFKLEIERLGKASPLFDLDKLTDISKNILSRMSAETVYDQCAAWAGKYDAPMLDVLANDPAYSKLVLNIERSGDAPRKDIANWSDVREHYGYFFDSIFEQFVPQAYDQVPPHLAKSNIAEALGYMIQTLPDVKQEGKDGWIQRMRQYAADQGYAARQKDFKNDPVSFKGWFGDLMMIIRIGLSGKTYTPDLYEMLQVLGDERAISRLEQMREHYS